MRPSATRHLILVSALVTWSTSAWADVCAGSAVTVDSALARRSPDLRARVRDALAAQQNLDPCAHIELAARTDAIDVFVELADGRSAERTVAQESDIVPTLAALLVLPQASEQGLTSREDLPPERGTTTTPAKPPHPVASPPSPLVALAASDRGSARDGAGDLSASLDAARPSHARFELAALTGARLGNGQTSLGVGASSFLEVSSWLVGFSGRLDQYHALGPGDSSSGALELVLLAGRRIHVGNVAFDFSAGPAAVVQGTSTMVARDQAGHTITETSSSTAPRAIVGARTSFRQSSTLRPFFGVDAEFGPARAAGTSMPSAPRLPLWTIGLSTGIALGT